MPDLAGATRNLHIDADLRFTVSDGRNQTAGRLTSGPDGLVLDVDKPAVLLRSIPGRGLARDLPLRMPQELTAGLRFQFQSGGSDLGVIRLTPKGKLRLSPSAAGWVTAGRTVASYGRARAAAWTAIGIAAALFAAARWRHRR